MNDSGDQSDYAPNALNQYQNVAGGDIYYDDKFNLMWTGGFSAGYDSENHLTAIGSGEDYGQFTYDGLGRCLKRTIDWETTLIAYDGWKPIVEWNVWVGNEQVYFKAWNTYGPGPDEILYRHDAARGDLRYHLDRMGNVAFLLDADGDGIEKYTYDAFGQPTVTDWNGENPRTWSYYGNRFMFTGREYFPELGLYDFRARFYHPVLGRFLQSDPIGFDGGDANLFRYCGNDPVNRSDPTGLDYDHDGRGDSDYAFDVRYDNHDDFLGWEAASYMRDVFARNDDASQRFDAYSVAIYEQSQQEQFSLGLISGNEQKFYDMGPTIQRLETNKRVYTYTKNGVKMYQVDITWTFILRYKGGALARNISVNETITHSNPFGFDQGTATNNNKTNSEGMATDLWGLGFTRPDGYVTTTQTISGPLGTAQWDLTLHANSEWDGPLITIFH